MENIKFIVDCMLGKLSRWLRILGFDTQYVRFLNDTQILAQARYQGRILLTKDTALYRRAGNLGCLVQSETIEKQLDEILTHFHLHPDESLTRCPHCNVLLETANKNEPIPQIPLYVLRSFPIIKVCPECCRSFWPGTHWDNIIKKVQFHYPNE